MSEQTPSQAEGERQEAAPDEERDVPRTTPSQAEGENSENTEDAENAEDENGERGEERAAWESGWSGP
ncbi:hypothetical protein [Streptomyces sp. NRRL B-24085]|uniref:hypothetical protein n=1 Tax=Streptomyces sp. NRRL B-24085 TaxID=1709476 RepID=UPI0006B331CD|nr:hypothetical protein [Streptomyces sp. NRRL B-24085]